MDSAKPPVDAVQANVIIFVLQHGLPRFGEFDGVLPECRVEIGMVWSVDRRTVIEEYQGARHVTQSLHPNGEGSVSGELGFFPFLRGSEEILHSGKARRN